MDVKLERRGGTAWFARCHHLFELPPRVGDVLSATRDGVKVTVTVVDVVKVWKRWTLARVEECRDVLCPPEPVKQGHKRIPVVDAPKMRGIITDPKRWADQT